MKLAPVRVFSCKHPLRVRSHYTGWLAEMKRYPVWYINTYPIYDSPLKSTARHSFAPLQKSRQNHRSYVWREALSGMVFVSAQKGEGGTSL